jgi:hypothetical protein
MRAHTALVALASLCLAPPALAAATVKQKLEKKLARYAQPQADLDFAKPRGLCACGASNQIGQPGRTGVLVYYFESPSAGIESPQVICQIPIFDDAGAVAESFPCVDWQLLSR